MGPLFGLLPTALLGAASTLAALWLNAPIGVVLVAAGGGVHRAAAPASACGGRVRVRLRAHVGGRRRGPELRVGCASEVLAATAVAATSLAVSGGAVSAHTTGIHDNCTNLNKKWPLGVGLKTARDKTSGTPVKSFYRNNKAYWAAERHNRTLDRDNDRIACEKR